MGNKEFIWWLQEINCCVYFGLCRYNSDTRQLIGRLLGIKGRV